MADATVDQPGFEARLAARRRLMLGRAALVGALAVLFGAVCGATDVPTFEPSASTGGDSSARAPLFSDDSTIELELETDLRALRQPGREPGFQPGVLRWRSGDESGEARVGVSPRGRFRLDRQNCSFPPLFFEFAQDAGGLFAGQRVVPVTTHCETANVQYVVQEYLIYRAFAQLTEHSVGARLARTRYLDSSGRGRPLDTVSFVMEHFDDLGERIGGGLVEEPKLRRDATDAAASALLELFQYMIGNTDWSMVAGHNIAIFRMAEGGLVPVPYDFDFSGVIDARYALPSKLLPIRSVRQRIYRGFCRPAGTVETAIDRLESGRPAIYRLYRETPELEPRLVERSLRYYDRFFEIVDSPRDLKRKILDACR